jgi:hypothetical protein
MEATNLITTVTRSSSDARNPCVCDCHCDCELDWFESDKNGQMQRRAGRDEAYHYDTCVDDSARPNITHVLVMVCPACTHVTEQVACADCIAECFCLHNGGDFVCVCLVIGCGCQHVTPYPDLPIPPIVTRI